MEVNLKNNTLSPVVLFSVDSMSKRERREGVVLPGGSNRFYVPNSFYVPGMLSDTELRIKDSDGYATIYTVVANTRARPGVTQDFRWQEQGNPAHSIDLSISEAQAVESEYSGLWTCRVFDPTYVTGNKIPQKERDLILADGFVFNFRTPTSTTLEGTFGLPDGGFPLALTGTVRPGVGGEPASFDIVGTGRPGTDTAGWEYRYHGHLTRNWPHAVDQRPALVGSVIRVKAHDDRRANEVFSFIAVKQQPPFTWELSGSWTYRSFHNNPTQLYRTEWLPSARQLILAEGLFKLESPTSTTLQGADEPLAGEVQRHDGTRQAHLFWDLKGTVRPEDASFEIVGTGRTTGKEFHYQGHLTRKWPNGIDQPGDAAQALVGSSLQSPKEPYLPAFCFPFIAVKQRQVI
jgi:hypothetical protein